MGGPFSGTIGRIEKHNVQRGTRTRGCCLLGQNGTIMGGEQFLIMRKAIIGGYEQHRGAEDDSRPKMRNKLLLMQLGSDFSFFFHDGR